MSIEHILCYNIFSVNYEYEMRFLGMSEYETDEMSITRLFFETNGQLYELSYLFSVGYDCDSYKLLRIQPEDVYLGKTNTSYFIPKDGQDMLFEFVEDDYMSKYFGFLFNFDIELYDSLYVDYEKMREVREVDLYKAIWKVD